MLILGREREKVNFEVHLVKHSVWGDHRLRLVVHIGPLDVWAERALALISTVKRTIERISHCNHSLVRTCKAVGNDTWQAKLENKFLGRKHGLNAPAT